MSNTYSNETDKKALTSVSKSDVGLSSVPNVDCTNASNISSGTLPDAQLSTNVTKQGNSFNGASQLVQLDGSSKLPAVDGSLLVNLPGGGGNVSASKITVYPTNTNAFPSYGVQQFTDLNAAWASIPRGDDSYIQHCNNWVVLIPANTYTPTSNNLTVAGTTNSVYSGYGIDTTSMITHWGYNWGTIQQTCTTTSSNDTITGLANINGLKVGMLVTCPGVPDGTYILSFPSGTSVQMTQQATASNSNQPVVFADPNQSLIGCSVTGPGIPANTTITAIGAFYAPYTGSGFYFNQGSTTVQATSTATLYPGQTIQRENYIAVNYINSITDGTHFELATPCNATVANSSLTLISCTYVKLSHAVTATNRNVNFTVNVPLVFSGTTNSSTSLTACSYVCNAMVGMTITGTNIPAATTVTAIAYNSTTNTGTITLSQPATNSGAGWFQMQLPDRFICDTSRRRIVNICLGPVELGQMYSSYPAIGNSGFWTPQPGADHFIDLHLQGSQLFYTGGTRWGWSWSSLPTHEEGNTTHEAYRCKSRISGTIKWLDSPAGLSCSWNLADMEVFGNPKLMTYSSQSGTTHSNTTLDGLTSTAGLMTGQKLSGGDIPSDTYIQSIVSSTSLTMTKAATGSTTATRTMAYVLPSTVSVDMSSVSIPLGLYTSIYKCRLRGSLIGNFNNASTTYHGELANAEDSEFSGFVSVAGYDKIRSCSFKAGMYWNSNTANFDNYGIYDTHFTTTASLNANATTSPLRVDAATNYWMKSFGTVFGANTVKLLMNDATSNAVNLTAQAAAIGSTTIFTPASDGIYRINVYASCTTSAVGDGTIAPTIGWRDDTTTQSLALTPLLLTVQGSYTQQSIVAKCKSGNAITYLTTLAGVQTTSQYALYVNVENIT